MLASWAPALSSLSSSSRGRRSESELEWPDALSPEAFKSTRARLRPFPYAIRTGGSTRCRSRKKASTVTTFWGGWSCSPFMGAKTLHRYVVSTASDGTVDEEQRSWLALPEVTCRSTLIAGSELVEISLFNRRFFLIQTCC